MIAVVSGFVLLLASFAAIASADTGSAPETEPGPLVSSDVDTPAELNALLGEGEEVGTGPATDPSAAESLPHTELDRGEAEDLLVSVFPTTTEDPGDLYSEVEPQAFHSDYVAVIAPDSPGEPASLLTSLLPLRTEDADGTKDPVDLSLEGGSQGELQPSNPLVDVTIPPTAAGEIELPEVGVGVELVSPEGERSASTIDGAAAFYPNVAEDSDLLVVPAATGFETFTQMRSAAAPTTHRFDLNVPQGATIEATSDGGAAVIKGEEPLVAVKPPTAIDAEGQAVPVTLSVVGDSIELQVAPSQETVFPVLLDPIFESYSWKDTGSTAGIETDWRTFETPNQSLFRATGIGNLNTILYRGLALRSYYGWITAGTSANFNYYVPRYFTDPTRPSSFIRNMKLSQVYYLIEENPGAGDPSLIAGIWDEKNGAFHSFKARNALEGAWSNVSLEFPNSQENTSVKNGGIALSSFNSVAFKRQVFVGQASVEVVDNDLPSWGYLPNPGIWTNNASANAPLDYAVSDSGLGISSIRLTRPQATGGSGVVEISNQCVGNASNPCPRTAETATRALPYDPPSMAQGESTISAVALDPVGNQSAPKLVKVKVDHEAPTVALSGNLTEQGTVGTKLAKYTLNYAASDGDDATAASSAPILGKGTGTGSGQMQRPMDVAVDASGNVLVVDRENNRVEKFDPSGNLLLEFDGTLGGGSKFTDPRSLTVTAAGNIWVAELGAKRLQEFNSKGEFIRKVTYEGPGQSSFVEPLYVAAGLNETLWVADYGSHDLYRFKETGAFLSRVNGLPSAALTTGVDVDALGNAWVAEQSTDKIYEFDSTGKLVFSFGVPGTEQGQLKDPDGVAVTASGNILVVDANNSRVQEFETDGTFLRKFSSAGTLNSQLTEPRGIAIGPGNSAYIADAGNHRIAKWIHVDQNPQSGAAKVEIKVDGTLKATNAPGCSPKNCVLNGSWTLNADEYTVGTHKVETIATDGVGLQTTKSLNVETHGDRTAPTVALSGSITEQATLGKTLPAYKVKASATDPGPAEERKSGVASIVIKVDNKVVDSVSPGCPSEGCSLNREWTLSSSAYSAGWHFLEATATDAAGKTKTAIREFEIKRDTTAPVLTLSGALAEAPEGWVQQGTKSLTANATDAGGYGVKQIRFQIDGKAVGESTVQSCELGSCTQSNTSSINLTVFAGGAHEGVVIAEDLAGNIKTETWTINVDPLGQTSDSEAADTVEAAEATAPEAMEELPVEGIVQRLPGEDGSEPGLALESGEIRSEGVPVESTVSLNPKEGFGLKVVTEEEEGPVESQEFGVMPIGIDPGAGAPVIVDDGAAVIPNTRPAVDTVLLPAYDGLMMFQDIRSASAPENYSWEVTHIGADETLKLIDEHHAGLFWEDGTQAMTITAQLAHSATGASVPTSLSVSGHIITLTVHHHETTYAYPVLAGAGWEGGFMTEAPVVIEPESPEEKELQGLSLSMFVGPPEVPPASDTEAHDPDGAGSSTANYNGLIKRWAANGCAPSIPLILDGCEVWKNHFKGFYYYNFNKAWFPNNRQPQCEPFAAVNWSIDVTECEWVGPNNQPYEHGYHITARTLWDVTFGLGVSAKTSSKAMVGRAFGSGNIYFHPTSDICNPSRPDCG
ncbi:MAG TPA: hypothetical protein VHP56_09000 [Solirubrobacterales bacterium]|jgi:streptogramin lyase|nr:hypothetical protein [Solirubrobacterales bacterium]